MSNNAQVLYELLPKYQTPTNMYANGSTEATILGNSRDLGAMAMYALGTTPLMMILAETLDELTNHMFLADDASAAGRLEAFFAWWKY